MPEESKNTLAGDIPSDMAIPEHHGLVEFQYWAIKPL